MTALVVATGLVLAACGADSGVRAGRSDDQATTTMSTLEPTTTTASTTTTTDVPITLPATTIPPTTAVPTVPPTIPPPTEAPTTTLGGVAAGWAAGPIPPGALDGCCEFLWAGAPSPAFPADPAAPLADGQYSAAASVPWSPANPNQLTVDIRRVDQCIVLGDEACVYGGPYADSDVSTAPNPVRTETINLDEHVAVVLGGFDMCASAVKAANGTDMVALLQAFGVAYDAVIGGPLAAGTSQEDVLAAITAAPSNGFVVADPDCLAGLLEFRAGDAPPVLLQTLTGYLDDGSRPLLTPTDLIRLVSIDQHNGLVTLTFYAGFRS